MAFNPTQMFAPDLPPGVTQADVEAYRSRMEDRGRNLPPQAATGNVYPSLDPSTTDIGGVGAVTPNTEGEVYNPNPVSSNPGQSQETPAEPPPNLPVTAATPLFGEDSHMAFAQKSDAERVARENALRGGNPGAYASASAKDRAEYEKIAKLNEQSGDVARQAGEDQAAISMEVADQISSHQRKADELNAAAQEKEQATLDAQDNYRKTIEKTRQETLEASQTLDPQRLIGPAGSRIMFVVSAALGALGQSLLGGRNNAVDLVNSMMEKDFEGQKARLSGKKENLSLMQDQLVSLRQQGMDERAARAVVMANLNEAMANRIASLRSQGMSAEQRANSKLLENQFDITAEQWRQKGYQATMRATAPKGPPAKPMTQAELLKQSQEALQREVNIRKGEQEIAKNAAVKGNEDNADIKRQADLATRVSAVNSALGRIQNIEDRMNDAQHPVGANELLFPNVANKRRSVLGQGDPSAPLVASQEIDSLADDIAASRGGPATDTDQAIGKARANIRPDMFNPMTWGTGAAKDRLKTLKTLLEAKREALLRGQPAQDVAAVERDSKPVQRPESAAEKAKRLGGRKP